MESSQWSFKVKINHEHRNQRYLDPSKSCIRPSNTQPEDFDERQQGRIFAVLPTHLSALKSRGNCAALGRNSSILGGGEAPLFTIFLDCTTKASKACTSG